MRVWLCIAGGKVSRPKYFMGYFSLEDKAYKKFLFYVYHYVGSFCVDSLRQGISTDDQFTGMFKFLKVKFSFLHKLKHYHDRC